MRLRHPWMQSSAINVEDDENVQRRKNSRQKKMIDGDREWSIPSFTYYAGHKHGQLQTPTNHYAAKEMTQTLAEQFTAKLNASGVESTV